MTLPATNVAGFLGNDGSGNLSWGSLIPGYSFALDRPLYSDLSQIQWKVAGNGACATCWILGNDLTGKFSLLNGAALTTPFMLVDTTGNAYFTNLLESSGTIESTSSGTPFASPNGTSTFYGINISGGTLSVPSETIAMGGSLIAGLNITHTTSTADFINASSVFKVNYQGNATVQNLTVNGYVDGDIDFNSNLQLDRSPYTTLRQLQWTVAGSASTSHSWLLGNDVSGYFSLLNGAALSTPFMLIDTSGNAYFTNLLESSGTIESTSSGTPFASPNGTSTFYGITISGGTLSVPSETIAMGASLVAGLTMTHTTSTADFITAGSVFKVNYQGNTTLNNLTVNGSCTGCNSGVASVNSLTGALSIAGTSNEITVTPAGSTITLATPQAIGTGSSPTFAGLTLTGALLGSIVSTDDILLFGGSTVQTNASFGTGLGTLDILGSNLSGNGYNALSSNVYYTSGGAWNLRNTANDGWLTSMNNAPGGGSWILYHAPSGANPAVLTQEFSVGPTGTTTVQNLTVNGSCTGCGGGVTSVNSLTGGLSIAGTSNEITVTPAGSTITLATPQAIGTGSSPTFAGLALDRSPYTTVSQLQWTVAGSGSGAYSWLLGNDSSGRFALLNGASLSTPFVLIDTSGDAYFTNLLESSGTIESTSSGTPFASPNGTSTFYGITISGGTLAVPSETINMGASFTAGLNLTHTTSTADFIDAGSVFKVNYQGNTTVEDLTISGTCTGCGGGGGVTVQSATMAGSSRFLGNVYHNTGAVPVFVSVSISCTSGTGCNCYAETDSASSPTTEVASGESFTVSSRMFMSFIVLAGNYYTVGTVNGSLIDWTEWH
jgi:flagellar basal body rod protein FlgC